MTQTDIKITELLGQTNLREKQSANKTLELNGVKEVFSVPWIFFRTGCLSRMLECGEKTINFAWHKKDKEKSRSKEAEATSKNPLHSTEQKIKEKMEKRQ